MKTRTVLLPFLFAIAPVVTLFANNLGQARPVEMLAPLAAVVLLALLLLPLATLALRGFARGAIALGLFFFLFFSYGPIASLVGRLSLGGSSLANPKLLLPVVALMWLASALAIRRTSSPPVRLGTILFVVVLSMLGTSLIPIARFYASSKSVPSGATLPDEAITAHTTGRRPDIYYVIFDRYTSARTLADRYGWDNAPTLDFLRAHGFYVAEDSRANYLVTAQSLASSLNMAHILPLRESVGPESTDWMPVFGMLRDHRVARFLKAQGYRYIQVGPKWNVTANNPFADANYQYQVLPEFSMILLQTTALYPVLYKFGIGRDDLEKFHRINYQLDLLGDLAAREQQPFFVFAHFLVPHGPFVFNHDGTLRAPAVAAAHTEPENYLEQLKFVNLRIRELVTRIQGHYPPDAQPVIVIQGDEGPYPARTQPHSFDWSQATDQELNEKMRILNAVCAPGCEASLYAGLTPVNTFRILFNCYFDTRLELLPDRSYIYRDLQHLYDFIEVTDRLPASTR